jgi:hypothetical protein
MKTQLHLFKYLRGGETNEPTLIWIRELEVTDIDGNIHSISRYNMSVDHFFYVFHDRNIFIHSIEISEHPIIYEENWLNESDYISLASNNDNTMILAIILPRRN